MQTDEVRAEVELWLATVRAAGVAAEALPAAIRRPIEAESSAAELLSLAVTIAGMSTRSRQRIERTLSHVLLALPEAVTPSAPGAEPHRPGARVLRLVEGQG